MENKTTTRVLFYPQRPSVHSTIYKIVKFLNCEIIDSPSTSWDIAISWEDTTFRKIDNLLPKNPDKIIINHACNDISKKNIDRIFTDVFGYSSLVNPKQYNGICVKKSNLNAKHNGMLIHCPIPIIEKNVIYQKLINNKNNNWGIYDIRTPIFNRSIPFVYIKQKSSIHRFEDHFIMSTIEETNVVFSPGEIDTIIEFCQQMGFEYGELDILRDSEDNRLYIIDANNTPWWSTSLPKEKHRFALERLAESFKREFFNL